MEHPPQTIWYENLRFILCAMGKKGENAHIRKQENYRARGGGSDRQ
ncbi:hypothetical protein B4135_1395 [Caldibacillus debilis]|uniref:Uncharacterized protein n=1 Tax=Caldibacillus debilis TaxID=301148 RepID=A0A150MD67_9BACI|nr:hypothetical protein B4135_1395 [Caldibacillus debilis]